MRKSDLGGQDRSPEALIRERLLLALHFGHKAPGDRVPSIRAMSRVTGLGRKAIHRAYERLASEGLIEMRPGSGTFFSEGGVDAAAAAVGTLLGAVARLREEAAALEMSESQLARFFSLCSGHRDLDSTIAVSECNHEQLGLIAQELGEALSTSIRPLHLEDLRVDPFGLLEGCSGLVTTNCHRGDVEALARPLRIPVYTVALADRFTESLIQCARERRLVMVVADRRYGPVLLRMLARMGVDEAITANLIIDEPERLSELVSALGPADALYVSPNLRGRSIPTPIRRPRRLLPGSYLDEASVVRLRAQVAANLVKRESPTRSVFRSA